MIEPDNETQEAIDAEETEAAAFADGQENETEEDEEYMGLLKALEKIDRQIVATEEDKKATSKKFRDKLNALKNLRQAALNNLVVEISLWDDTSAIAASRAGERGLPFNEND